MIVFKKAGESNTGESLKLAFDEAKKRGIKCVLIASTKGETAKQAVPLIKQSDVKCIIVTHNYGFSNPGEQQFDPKIKELVEKSGGIVYSGTMVLRGLGRAFKNKGTSSQEEVVANSLRMISQGVKVCCEMSAMICDAGMATPEEDILCVAGTGWGADTVCIIKPNSSNNFFEIKVKEILAKPSDF